MASGAASSFTSLRGMKVRIAPLRWQMLQLQDSAPLISLSNSRATAPQWQVARYFIGFPYLDFGAGSVVVTVEELLEMTTPPAATGAANITALPRRGPRG